MLQQENRLKERFEFLKLKRSGKTIFTPLFNFSFIQLLPIRPGFAKPPSFGFVTSTHLDKRATVRNRVKRKVREAVRLFLKNHTLPAGYPGLLGVFIIRKAALTKNYEEISGEVNKVLSDVFKL